MALVLFFCNPFPVAAWGGSSLYSHFFPSHDKPGLVLWSDACKELARWGHQKDGGWTVCMDPLKNKARGRKCVVYSFGINVDWTFDDAAANHGCEVHGFDPTINFNESKAKYDSNLKTLHPWGLALGLEDRIFPPGTASFEWPGIGPRTDSNTEPWELRTISSIMKALNHSALDVLKVDVEGAEWGGLTTFMKSGGLGLVSQLVCEFHFDPQAHNALKLRYGTILANISSQMLLINARANSDLQKQGWDPKTCCGEFSFLSQKLVGHPKKGQTVYSPYLAFPQTYDGSF
eukprot:gb/GEZN01013234.1/.p1 GENE.gb/GEZN01013234.1/~~gb/GEZN01013234.1/.p1  ORF type:complete len:330 (+),score=29.98 gb/GEZN01013234.1/:125-991(+)